MKRIYAKSHKDSKQIISMNRVQRRASNAAIKNISGKQLERKKALILAKNWVFYKQKRNDILTMKRKTQMEKPRKKVK